ncbi:MAG: transcriptional regulator [Clostridiales bacterium]|nr:transcriptional regulator [Clostridiales bacterium]
MENKELLELFERCGHFLYHRRGSRRGQNKIVKILVTRGSMSQKELLDILDIKSGSLSELVSKLEAKGYIKKEKDPKDKRRTILTATEQGRAYLESLETELTKQDDILFSELSEEEKLRLYNMLEKLLTSWRESFDPSLFNHRDRKRGKRNV